MKKQNEGHCMPNDAKCAKKAANSPSEKAWSAPESKENKQHGSAKFEHESDRAKRADVNAREEKSAVHKK